ncbi:MAG: ATP-binding cassette domain-containing protein [Gemmatimonadetes bacterium]|nr:ATP-binding cassette domain-containing protein [Gemmatimonadota bacterium]
MTRQEPPTASDGPAAARLSDVSKWYGSVAALDGADLTLRAGEIHALVGQNGAGKTTLGRVLGGLEKPDGGSIHLRGREFSGGPGEARGEGIALVHQHFSLVPRFTGLENIRLFSSEAWTRGGRPLAGFRRRVEAKAASLDLDVPLDRPVETLDVGVRQRIEVLKALMDQTRILILDEPTAVLAPQEVTRLFQVLGRLADEGTAICLIAHKLSEILSVSHRITVLRDGRTAWSGLRREATREVLVQAMMGSAEGERPATTARTGAPGGVVGRLRGVRLGAPERPLLVDVDLEVRRGEVVGIAGIAGNGQRALASVLAGIEAPDAGSAHLPTRRGWIPQDRSLEGLIPSFSLTENVALALHGGPEAGSAFHLDWGRIRSRTEELIADMRVRTSGPQAPAATLSGGNQQKLLTARELSRAGDLLVAESPTRGLDVSAAKAVHRRLLELVAGPAPPGVVLISTDLDEILDLSDRILVLHRGKLAAVGPGQRDPQVIGRLMLEGPESGAPDRPEDSPEDPTSTDPAGS